MVVSFFFLGSLAGGTFDTSTDPDIKDFFGLEILEEALDDGVAGAGKEVVIRSRSRGVKALQTPWLSGLTAIATSLKGKFGVAVSRV